MKFGFLNDKEGEKEEGSMYNNYKNFSKKILAFFKFQIFDFFY